MFITPNIYSFAVRLLHDVDLVEYLHDHVTSFMSVAQEFMFKLYPVLLARPSNVDPLTFAKKKSVTCFTSVDLSFVVRDG